MSEKRRGRSRPGGREARESQARGELERGRAAYARRAWEEAYRALSLADQAEPLAGDDIELLAWTAALTGRHPELLGTLERLHQSRLEAGECAAAARAAFWLGLRLNAVGESARAGGWMARAQRLVEREEQECVEHGYLILPMVYRAMASGEYDQAHEAAVRAAQIGDRFGDVDLTSFARYLEGRVLVQQGRAAEGLGLFDEVMVAVAAGELSPVLAGTVYCGVISACQEVYALDRAREWTSALADWCAEQPELVTFTGTCLVHRSEIMQLGGAWQDAIEEARRASERFLGSSLPEAVADAFYQQAEIHRLRGELSEAEEAYRSASQHGREPQPGLALLRLAQGNPDAAVGSIRRVLEGTTAPLARASFLPAYVEILLRSGDLREARKASDELAEIANGFGTDVLGAIADHALGAVALAEGDAKAAVPRLRRAFEVWQSLGAPYIAARIRVLLGRACRALEDDDGCRLELDAARRVFEELGARPDLAALEAELGESPAAAAGRSHGLTARELEVLRLVASGKTNKAIAKELFLSEKTIDRHVSNIFTKVNVGSRAAATAFAYEHGLI